MKQKKLFFYLMFAAILMSCEKNDDDSPTPVDPDMAEEVSVDRFSSEAGNLFVRDANNGFPEANEPIDFDMTPAFITKGLGPDGELVQYYNFDVQPLTPAPIYVLFKDGASSPVDGQLNIIDVIPGDANYNDFWLVVKVTVPDDYVANTVTSYSEIVSKGYATSATDMIVNCPVVPKGSVATKRYSSSESADLTRGWYNSKVVYYFNFTEKMLTVVNGNVPTSDIFVSFNINPDMTGGGPPSGFKTEDGMDTGQTHNVPETLPEDDAYSPLWDVQIYDNMDFEGVGCIQTAMEATLMAEDAAVVNCPIVSVEE